MLKSSKTRLLICGVTTFLLIATSCSKKAVPTVSQYPTNSNGTTNNVEPVVNRVEPINSVGTTNNVVRVKVITPCTESKKTDTDFFRSCNSGTSPSESFAKQLAMQNAMQDMASSVQGLVSSVLDQYSNQYTDNKKQDLSGKAEGFTRSVVNQTLKDVRTVIEELYMENSSGNYIYYIGIEMPKQPVMESTRNVILQDEKLRVDYDKKKFEEIFNQEMEKLKQEKGGGN